MNTKNVLLGILIVIVFGTGFMIGRFSSVGNNITNVTQTPDTASVSQTNEQGAVDDINDDNVSIDASDLTDGQKNLLSALGIDANSITITSAMMVCAETSLGSARVTEITNGATPSFTEGLKLAACYK